VEIVYGKLLNLFVSKNWSIIVNGILQIVLPLLIIAWYLQKYILEHGEPEQRSGKQEQLEAMLNRYV